MSAFQSIAEKIETCSKRGETKLVAIDGRGGSGKSFLAAKLVALHPTWSILPVDDFPCPPKKYPFHSQGTQTRIDFERLRDEGLSPLLRGKDARYLRTPWWKSQEIGPMQEVSAGGTVIVEGCYSLLPDLRDYYDLKIWIECDIEHAIEKALLRDGADIRQIWEEVYVPNESAYIRAHTPVKVADLVVLSIDDDFKIGT